MRWMNLTAGMLGVAIAAGCAANKKDANTVQTGGVESNSAVTDVTPPPAPTPAPAPIPVQPAAEPPAETVTPSAAAPAGGQTYTVKHGDTLYSIARAHYGDGKAYKKILAANPGLSPTHLKVGQVINLP